MSITYLEESPPLRPSGTAAGFAAFVDPEDHDLKATHRGLGLSILRQIAKRHNAVIQLDSDAGRGSCIEVWFPGGR